MKHMYLIASNPYAKDVIDTYAKQNMDNWGHYFDTVWFVVTEKLLDVLTEEITNALSGTSLNIGLCQFVVTEMSEPKTNGILKAYAWDWLKRSSRIVDLSKEEAPTLTSLCRNGYFNKAMSNAYCIADIDKILEPYTKESSPFELESVRNRMIEYVKAKLSGNLVRHLQIVEVL